MYSQIQILHYARVAVHALHITSFRPTQNENLSIFPIHSDTLGLTKYADNSRMHTLALTVMMIEEEVALLL